MCTGNQNVALFIHDHDIISKNISICERRDEKEERREEKSRKQSKKKNKTTN